MAQKLTMTVLTLILAAAAATGCGRKSGLEPPSRAAIVDNDRQSSNSDVPEEKPDRPFILDGLIE